jgi:ABC-type amino acid transport system permease subunit
MTGAQAMRRVVLPQAVKRMMPAFMERSIELMKTTTLVATVSATPTCCSRPTRWRRRPSARWRFSPSRR